MTRVRFSVRNARQLAADVALAARNYGNAAFSEVEKELQRVANRIIETISSSEEYRRLQSDPILRGKLGLARQGLKTGGDTDAEDLLKELSNFKITRTRRFTVREFTLTMPTLRDLEEKLTHRLTRRIGGSFTGGPSQSWFRWWEFGDQGEIDTLTIFKRGSQSAARRSGINTVTLSRLIDEQSRSGFAIQSFNKPADLNSSITGSNLIGRTYGNFAQVLPATVGKVLQRFARNNRPNNFFIGVTR